VRWGAGRTTTKRLQAVARIARLCRDGGEREQVVGQAFLSVRRSICRTPALVTKHRPSEKPRFGSHGAKRGTSFQGTPTTDPIRAISSCQVIFVTKFAQLLENTEKLQR
jgi:hypothetical protein